MAKRKKQKILDKYGISAGEFKKMLARSHNSKYVTDEERAAEEKATVEKITKALK